MSEPQRVPTGTDAVGVQPGDMILCHRRGLASGMIRLGEWLRLRRANVSHAAFCETAGTLIEALTRGVVRTPLSHYRHVEYWIVRAGLTGEDQRQAVAFARSCVGQRYGFLTDVGIALRFLTPGRGLWFGMNGTEVCSGLCGQAQVRGWTIYPVNPAAISPQELFDFYSNLKLPNPLAEVHMQSVLDRFVTAIAALLAPVSPFTKAVVPGVSLLAVAVVNALIAGQFNTTSIVSAACAVVLSIVTYLVPNKRKPTPVAPIK